MSTITTGFESLDEIIGGFRTGDLVAVGSLPGVGKSTLVWNFASHAALTLGVSTLILPLVDYPEDVASSMVCANSSVDVSNFRNGTCVQDEAKRAHVASTVLETAPVGIVDRPPLDIAGIVALIYENVSKNDVGLVVIDPVQWLAKHGDTQELSAVCRELKRVARDTDTVIVIVSQIEQSTNRLNDVPSVNDFQGAFGILPHVDVAMVLHRPDFRNEWSDRVGEADLIVGKNKRGRLGSVWLAHQLHFGRFLPVIRS